MAAAWPKHKAACRESTRLSQVCDACGKTELEANAESSKLRFCNICLLARYCSEECRAAAEPAHKAACLAAHIKRKGKGKAAAANEGGEAGGSGAGPSGI